MVCVLEANEIRKKLGSREVIKDVSFSIKEGEIFGFVGQNGSGKTTTIRMLVGLITQDSGEISIMGHNIKHDRENALAHVERHKHCIYNVFGIDRHAVPRLNRFCFCGRCGFKRIYVFHH